MSKSETITPRSRAVSLAASKHAVWLTWHDVSFFVNNKGPKRVEQLTDLENGPIKEHNNILSERNKNKKTILHSVSGFAKPGQLMAIMGASGCGKTSLLNIFGQRLGLSPGSRMEGHVSVNNIKLKMNDFGKFGAFV